MIQPISNVIPINRHPKLTCTHPITKMHQTKHYKYCMICEKRLEK